MELAGLQPGLRGKRRSDARTIPVSIRRSVELNREFAQTVEKIQLDIDLDRVYTNRFVDLAAKGK
jgi:hypothetical protein